MKNEKRKHIKFGKVLTGRITVTLDHINGIATIKGGEDMFELNIKKGEIFSLYGILGRLIDEFPEFKCNQLGERLAQTPPLTQSLTQIPE